MERSGQVLVGGAIIVVIAIIAIYFTGMGTSSPVSRAGGIPGSGPVAGYGQGAGPGAGQGAGYGAGPGSGSAVLLPPTDAAPISAAEAADLLYMREEEQMAYDLYTRWADLYATPVFSNIAASETQHLTQVQLLLDRYGLSGNRTGTASTGYRNATIQSLYTALAKQGDASLAGAFEAGLAVEERDIADLDLALADTTRSDIVQVYTNLRQGSENHRSAFLRQLGR